MGKIFDWAVHSCLTSSSMLNFVRLSFLILSLCVAGFAWALGAHPEWVGAVDRWLCDRHMQETQELWDRVQETVEEDGFDAHVLHGEVQVHLLSLGDVHFGDRRFRLWRELVLWCAAEARESGELSLAIDWQALLMSATPYDSRQGAVYIELLMENGRPKDLKEARRILVGIRTVSPTWEPAQKLDFRLAVVEENWDFAIGALKDLQAGDEHGLAKGWQFFFRPEGVSKIQKSSRMNVDSVSKSSLCEVDLEFPHPLTMDRLRVDPPTKAVGLLQRLRLVGLGTEGQSADLRILKAVECEWDEGLGHARLSGQSDPRLSLLPPDFPLRAIRVSFQPLGALPEDVLQVALEHETLRAWLKSQGIRTVNSEEVR